MGRIRIAYCIDTFEVGGTELNALRTAEALDPGRYELRVFHLQAGGPLFERYRTLGAAMLHVPIHGFRSPQTISRGLRWGTALRTWPADIVHCHDVYTNIFFGVSARVTGGAKVLTSRRWWDELPRKDLAKLNRVSYSLSHRVLANSRSVASMLIEKEGVPAGKVVEIRNFVELADEPPSQEQRVRLRTMLRIPQQAFVVGLVGRLVPVKNHALVIRALHHLPKEVHAAFVGAGSTRESLEALASALGVRERVHFAGEVVSSESPHLAFDVSVLCSFSEGFPNSILEAMASRAPVIATPVGGVVDAVVDGKTGLLVSPSDAPALANAVIRLKQDLQLRRRLIESASELIREKYERSIVLDELQALYERLSAS